MNYDLARELKDAGFPQNGSGAMLSRKGWEHNKVSNYGVGNAYAPTLEELIEACGDRELVLSKHESAVDGKYVWRAIVLHQEPLGFGATPVEAVARLWLALNRK